MRALDPVRRSGEFVFCVADHDALVVAEATVREEEGLTLVLPRQRADELGLEYAFVAAWITLRLESELEGVGLTALFSGALAEAGIAGNVIAGYHHDHLLVPADRADEALELLRGLAW